MSGKYYGTEIDLTDEKEIEEIEQFISEGTEVILVGDLEDLSSINPDEVQMIKREDDEN